MMQDGHSHADTANAYLYYAYDKGKKVVVLVEDIDDYRFWEGIFTAVAFVA